MIDKNINEKYGKLTIIKLDHIDKYYVKHYLCKCDCGKEKVINFANIKYGKTKSCGCDYKNILGKLYKKNNKYRNMGNYIIGYTTNTNQKFYIDKEDYEKIKNISWYEDRNGYIAHKETNKKLIFLHRLLCNNPNKLIIDHINHNKRDNRKNNLRTTTYKINSLNKRKLPKGITKNKVGNNTYYKVQLNGIGKSFKTHKEAKKYRDEIIKKYYMPLRRNYL